MVSKTVKKTRRYSKDKSYYNERKIELNLKNPIDYSMYKNNGVKTSKYNLLNFIPLNFFYQFSKVANIYFLILTILQTVKTISITNGVPTIAPSLVFVIFVSMVKDLLEDLKRWKSDAEENNGGVLVFENGFFQKKTWKDLKVGKIVKIQEDEPLPADLIVLGTSNENGKCYIETKNLDGETNLKIKKVANKLSDIFSNKPTNYLMEKSLGIKYEAPNSYLYVFKGFVQVYVKDDNNVNIPLDNNNIILRGSSLKNTDYIIGVVCYSGHQTKVMMNSIKAREKKSLLETQLNSYIILVFLFLIIFCMIGAAIYILWINQNFEDIGYLEINLDSSLTDFLKRFGNWLLIFGNFLPISLIVTIEMVKFFQAILMSKNKNMIDKNNRKSIVQSSNLNEELGQINYIFSDKTGTLTCNDMIFKYIIVGDKIFGEKKNEEEISIINKEEKPSFIRENIPHVDFDDNSFFCSIKENEDIKEIIQLLGTCHDINIHKNEYQANSPDELALVYFAKKCGFEFSKRNEKGDLIIDAYGKKIVFKVLEVFQFSSDRKRMSIIVKDKDDKIWLYCKGADNIIFSRSDKVLKNGKDVSFLEKAVDNFAVQGLRTLVLARKKITQLEYSKFSEEYEKAMNDLNNREKKIKILQSEFENGLQVIGATVIEDKLQDQVPESIKDFIKAGIKVWVLTGDKMETAINIGHSTNLISKGLLLLKLSSFEKSRLRKSLNEYLKNLDNLKKSEFAFVISGDALITIFQNQKLKKKLTKIILFAKSVICCRVSPKQKALIVKMVKEAIPTARTLGIGDGANDVNMIVAANVGVGIKGFEGQQAARSSDYVIGEFKLLHTLLFFYGREYYRKNSYLILYNFWKNVILVLPQFFYALLYNNFSGVTLYEGYLYQFVNVFYTSIPIIIFAIYDQELLEEELKSNPKYYKIGLQRLLFNTLNFSVWYFKGICQAFFICLLSSFIEMAPQKNGRFLGFWGFGIIVFLNTQIVSNIKILIISNSYNFWVFFFTFGSFLLFILSFFLVNISPSNDHYELLEEVLGSPIFYISLIMIITVCSFFDYLWNLAQKIIFFNYINIVLPQKKVKDEILETQTLETFSDLEKMENVDDSIMVNDKKHSQRNMDNETRIILSEKTEKSSDRKEHLKSLTTLLQKKKF